MSSRLNPLGRLFNQSPVPYVGTSQTGIGLRARLFGASPADPLAQMSAMGASATLFSVVNRTSGAVAAEQWHLHRTGTALRDSTCEYDGCDAKGVQWVEKHPALTVLETPNKFYTEQEMFESGQQHVDLTGEGWLVIERLGSMPYELWLARPDRIAPVPSERNFIVGYIYTTPDGQEIPLRKENVMSMRMPNPVDPYRGMGPVQTVLNQIDSVKYSAQWNRSLFMNGSRPGGIIKVKPGMSDPDFDQLVTRWEQNHQGIANAGRTAFLEDGEWQDVTQMTVKDMQFVETAELNRDTILLAFGASKFDVGVLEDVNRAASEAAKASFGERMTIPRLDRWKGMLNNDFLPQFPGFNYDLQFVYSNPVPADREADRADREASVRNYCALVAQGVDPVQAANVCGLPPMDMVSKPAVQQKEEVPVP